MKDKSSILMLLLSSSVGIYIIIFLLLVFFILLIAMPSTEIEQLGAGKKEVKSTEAQEVSKGGLYWVDVDKDKLQAWICSKWPGTKDKLGSSSSVDSLLKHCKNYDVNPIFLIAIAGKETCCGTASSGPQAGHIAAWSIAGKGTAGSAGRWRIYNTWDECIEDAAKLIGVGYLHSREERSKKWPDLANYSSYYYDTGEGSNPQWTHGKGVMGGSKEYDPNATEPNVAGVGAVYCEGPANITIKQWVEDEKMDAWPHTVTKLLEDGCKYCGVSLEKGTTTETEEEKWTTVCLDPGGGTQANGDSPSQFYNGESADVLNIINMTKTYLQELGYDVVLTKAGEEENPTLEERASIANQNQANTMVQLRSSNNGPHAVFYCKLEREKYSESLAHYLDKEIGYSNQLFKAAGDMEETAVDSGVTATMSNLFNGSFVYIDVNPAYISSKLGATDDDKDMLARGIAVGIDNFIGYAEKIEEKQKSSDIGNRLVEEEEKYLGWKYLSGGDNPNDGGFDCSGLIYWCASQIGISVPRTTYGYAPSSVLEEIKPSGFDDLQAGDIIICKNGEHAITYCGTGEHSLNGQPTFLHSPHTGDVIKKVAVSGWNHTYFGGNPNNRFFRLKGEAKK